MQRVRNITTWIRLLPNFLILSGAALLVLSITADLLGIGGQSGFGPNQLSLALSGFTLLTTGIALTLSEKQRPFVEWFLVGVGVLVVALAADLLVIGGLPGLLAKQLMLGSVVAGTFLIGELPTRWIQDTKIREFLPLDRSDVSRLVKFAAVSAQLGLLVLITRQFEIENQAFYQNIIVLTFYGFIIHYFLPARYRMPFFVALSLAAVFGVFGVTNAVLLIGLGIGLILITHLPIRFIWRTVLLLTIGFVLAFMRIDRILGTLPGAFWPILGSMFMFRLIIYMYDLEHAKKQTPTITSTLAYFFLLPNVVFPLFPVVDHSTFRRTYYNDEQHDIYQKGIYRILRGIIQMVLYRYVNYNLVISPDAVSHFGDFIHFIVPNFLLILRVTGQFDIITGILHLFGFNLPEVNHRIFWASSFTDFWRRANIYWKDFMVKVFYFPVYFRLKGWNDTIRLVIATLVAFAVTWFLHAYQWFWLRGTFLLTGPDILYWSLFGILVLANSLYETRHSKQRTLKADAWSFRKTALQSLGTIGVFGTISVLWSLWISPSVTEWVVLLRTGLRPPPDLAGWTPLLLVLAFLVGGKFLSVWIGGDDPGRGKKPVFVKSAGWTTAAALSLYLIANPAVYGLIGGSAQALVEDLRVSRLSDRDAELLLQGYYEDLNSVNQFNSELWDVYSKRPSDWPLIQDTEAARMTDDFLVIELLPSRSLIFHGERFSTNRWGMRDQEYELTPPPGTFRIALLGPSFVMGSGVSNEQTFEAIVEDRLNKGTNVTESANVEILNFGVAGYSALQELLYLETKVVGFEPDAIFYVGHQIEGRIVIRALAGLLLTGVEPPYEYLQSIIQEAGITTDMTDTEAEQLLSPYEDDILSWTYERMVALAEAQQMVPVYIYLPTAEFAADEADRVHLLGLAEAAGFLTIDLSEVYSGYDVDELIVAEWDKHPNAKGHQLIAAGLFSAIVEQNNLSALRDQAGLTIR